MLWGGVLSTHAHNHLMRVSRRDDVGLDGLRHIFTVPHGVPEQPEQLPGDLWRHSCVWKHTNIQSHEELEGFLHWDAK